MKILFVFVSLLFIGCATTSTPRQGNFNLQVENILLRDNLQIKRLIITTDGVRTVRITENEDKNDSDITTTINNPKIYSILVAQSVGFQKNKQKSFLFTACSESFPFPNLDERSSSDMSMGRNLYNQHFTNVVILTPISGEYSVNKDIQIGSIQGFPLILRVD